MGLGRCWRALAYHSMRGYYVAIVAGAGLVASAFLPWILVGEQRFGGAPDMAGLWILGLGVLAIVLASLSVVTRKNSRHPLLLVGLAALGIMFLAYQLMARVVAERVWAVAQAQAIVGSGASTPEPEAVVGAGIYLGLTAAVMLVLFGLTIVVKQVASPYPEPDDDDT